MEHSFRDNNVTRLTEKLKDLKRNLLGKSEENIETNEKIGESTNIDSNPPILINYVTLNRLGLTKRNLSRILESTEDF